MIPETLYARSRGADIAYRVLGEGRRDVVVSMGVMSHLDLYWEVPEHEGFLDRMTQLGRVIVFDRRGTGLSDRDLTNVSPEQWCDDVAAVMDAAQSDRAVLFGWLDAGTLSLLTAALHPGRVSAVIAADSHAVGHRDDDFPFGPDPQLLEIMLDVIESGGWGRALAVGRLAPKIAASARHLAWLRRLESMSASPRAAAQLLRISSTLDLRPHLGQITPPVLLLHDVEMEWIVSSEAMRWLADRLPNALLRSVRGQRPKADLLPFDDFADEIEIFLGAERHDDATTREAVTLLITDVVGSTEAAVSSGDVSFKYVMAAHFEAVRRSLARFDGTEIKSMGDGFLTCFRLPSAALRCAAEIVADAQATGLRIQAGIHSGEVIHQGGDVVGVAVHVTARVSAAAGPSEVLFTETIKTVVMGSNFAFESAGIHTLKGVPGEWPLYRLISNASPRARGAESP